VQWGWIAPELCGDDAVLHKFFQYRLIPGVPEISMDGDRITACWVEAHPTGCGVLDLGKNLHDPDRMSGRAGASSGVGHVTLVVGTVQVRTVPAVREQDGYLEIVSGWALGHVVLASARGCGLLSAACTAPAGNLSTGVLVGRFGVASNHS
jgi:hypothetical protein